MRRRTALTVPCQHHAEPPCAPSLVEELVDDGRLPGSMRGWRRYRIEYGFEYGCPEGLIYLPPEANPEDVEALLRGAEWH